MASESGALTNKQELFCREYLIDLNATRAAIRAGYTDKAATATASRLLTKAKVQARIASLKAARVERVDVDADYVLNRLVEIDQMDVVDILNDDCSLKHISEWPDAWRKTLSGLDVSETYVGSSDAQKDLVMLKKIKWPDKVKNLELIGRHVQVGAWDNKVDHTSSDRSMSPQDTAGAIVSALERKHKD